LVELGAAMMVASTMVPERSSSRRASNRSATASKMHGSARAAQQVAEAQNRTLVRHHLSPSSTRAKRRIDSCRRSHLGLWVRQIEPLLQEINPQHLLQSSGWRLGRLWVVRSISLTSRDHGITGIHLGQRTARAA